MELNKKHEIKLMKSYLPGFNGGFTPTVDSPLLQSSILSGLSGSIPTSWQGEFPGAIQMGAIEQKLKEPLKLVPYLDRKTPKVAQSTLAESGGNIVSSGIAFAGSTMKSFGSVKGTDEILSDAGTSFAQGDGFGYQKQNDVDASYLMSELSKENTNNTLGNMGTGAALGAAVGSVIPGVGTVIGGAAGAVVGLATGLFGGASRRRRLARKIFAANQLKEASNLFNRTSAHSDYLNQQYEYKHENTQDDLLYGAKGGKDAGICLPGFADGFGVYTNTGLGTGSANSRVAFGETIYNPNKGTANIVKTGRLNLDTNLSYLLQDDVVFGNHKDWRTGMTFRDEALPYAAVLEYLNNK